jgi:hypothetical protein
MNYIEKFQLLDGKTISLQIGFDGVPLFESNNVCVFFIFADL